MYEYTIFAGKCTVWYTETDYWLLFTQDIGSEQ